MASRKKQSSQTDSLSIELEIAKGLEDIALDELVERFERRIVSDIDKTPGALKFDYTGNPGGLLSLLTINAAYLVETFPIPRPKAFLGHQYKAILVERIQQAMQIVGRDAYTTIHINAAGSGSSVMQRILIELGEATSLVPDAEAGDMTLRLRPSASKKGWDAMVRLSPRPNATRSWRVVNVPGALNAAVAHAMVRLSEPSPEDTVLNVAGGSGSIAIERALHGPAQQILLCDVDDEMLSAAHENIGAAGLTERIDIRDWNALDIPMS
ncbi:MAG: RNA methyltransferase, partial [Chloroflexota bacterium]